MLTPTTSAANLPINFHQVVISMRPNAKAPITIPEVGVMRLRTPEADWNAVITRCAGTFAYSPSGAIIPMVAPARPDVDGIRNDIGK